MPPVGPTEVAAILQAFHHASRQRDKQMLPHFGHDNGKDGFALLCPSCGGDFLHHDRVEVYEPLHEDAETGHHVIVAGGQTTVTSDLTGNPSARRNGLTIRFWCEGCWALPLLRFAQHKGTTYVQFIIERQPVGAQHPKIVATTPSDS